jgi:hypothetical protein
MSSPAPRAPRLEVIKVTIRGFAGHSSCAFGRHNSAHLHAQADRETNQARAYRAQATHRCSRGRLRYFGSGLCLQSQLCLSTRARLGRTHLRCASPRPRPRPSPRACRLRAEEAMHHRWELRSRVRGRSPACARRLSTSRHRVPTPRPRQTCANSADYRRRASHQRALCHREYQDDWI